MKKYVLSLGAGVQSSTLALMFEKGDIDPALFPKPDAAIFADTQDESEEVYLWLDWLQTQLSYPVRRISKGSLSKAALNVRVSQKTGKKYLQTSLPLYTKGETDGILRRQCTTDFKVRAIQSEIRRLFGVKYLRKEKAYNSQIIQYIGISKDEAIRVKPSRLPFITNEHPLVDLRITRADCFSWMVKNGFPKPPRSACVYCPFHSDAEWIRLKTEQPNEFQKAVEFERDYFEAFRRQNALTNIGYLHDSRKPLSEVEFDVTRQISLFGNECEGMCGV